MAMLPLSNTNYGVEKNICFVNSSIQLLCSIPYIRDFFQLQLYSTSPLRSYKLCSEITKLFTRREIKSTAFLRILLGSKEGLERFMDSSQQDAEAKMWNAMRSTADKNVDEDRN